MNKRICLLLAILFLALTGAWYSNANYQKKRVVNFIERYNKTAPEDQKINYASIEAVGYPINWGVYISGLNAKIELDKFVKKLNRGTPPVDLPSQKITLKGDLEVVSSFFGADNKIYFKHGTIELDEELLLKSNKLKVKLEWVQSPLTYVFGNMKSVEQLQTSFDMFNFKNKNDSLSIDDFYKFEVTIKDMELSNLKTDKLLSKSEKEAFKVGKNIIDNAAKDKFKISLESRKNIGSELLIFSLIEHYSKGEQSFKSVYSEESFDYEVEITLPRLKQFLEQQALTEDIDIKLELKFADGENSFMTSKGQGVININLAKDLKQVNNVYINLDSYLKYKEDSADFIRESLKMLFNEVAKDNETPGFDRLKDLDFGKVEFKPESLGDIDISVDMYADLVDAENTEVKLFDISSDLYSINITGDLKDKLEIKVKNLENFIEDYIAISNGIMRPVLAALTDQEIRDDFAFFKPSFTKNLTEYFMQVAQTATDNSVTELNITIKQNPTTGKKQFNIGEQSLEQYLFGMMVLMNDIEFGYIS